MSDTSRGHFLPNVSISRRVAVGKYPEMSAAFLVIMKSSQPHSDRKKETFAYTRRHQFGGGDFLPRSFDI